jgi:DNA-binding MarR family transcriptional regulator
MEKEIISLIEELDKVLKRSFELLGKGKEFSQLTLGQLNYLNVIYRMELPTITSVANELRLSKPTVTSAVQKLIELGFLKKRQSSEDKRIYFLSLSDLGLVLVSARENSLDDFLRVIKGTLTSEEQSQFETLIKKIISNLKESCPA